MSAKLSRSIAQVSMTVSRNAVYVSMLNEGEYPLTKDAAEEVAEFLVELVDELEYFEDEKVVENALRSLLKRRHKERKNYERSI